MFQFYLSNMTPKQDDSLTLYISGQNRSHIVPPTRSSYLPLQPPRTFFSKSIFQ